MLSREFRISKSAAAAPTVKADETPHELTHIRVEEVSLVDAPANRRKFLVTKRDKTQKGVVRVIDPAGIDAPWAELDRADAARAQKAASGDPAAEPVVEPPAPAAEPPVAEPPAAEPPVAEPPVAEPPVVEPPAGEPPAAEPAAPDADKTPVVEVKEEIAVKAEVAKVGRPMKRARLDRMKAAFKELSEILSELDVDEEKAEPAAKAEPAVPAPPAPPAPAVAVKAEAPAPPAAPVVAQIPATPVPAVKADANAAEIQKLTAMVQTLQKMVEQQGVQLAKSRQPVDSNAISLEKSNSGHDKVLWDGDMASPQARVRGRSF